MEKEEFIKRLTELRMNKGVSAREMSLSVGMNENYINRLENGAGLPKMETFLFMCDYLGVTPQNFFDVETPDPIKSRKLYLEAHSLSSAQLDVVLDVIREIKNK